MLVVNLFGGPGTGKSTTAAATFALLKHRGARVELVTEYAKDLVYDEHFHTLDNTLRVFAEQHHRIWRLEGKVDFVITDSPLLLSLVYGSPSPILRRLIEAEHERLPTLNVFLTRHRAKPYQAYGRMQTEPEAQAIDTRVREMLEANFYPYSVVEANKSAAQAVIYLVTGHPEWWKQNRRAIALEGVPS